MRPFEARISGVDAKDFPPIPVEGRGVNTKVEVEALRLGIGQVVFAPPRAIEAGTDRSGHEVRGWTSDTGRC